VYRVDNSIISIPITTLYLSDVKAIKMLDSTRVQ